MIISLTEATRESAGGKAAVLGELARAGFPVPDGFVVPVEVYRAATSSLDLAAVLADHGPDEVRRLIESEPLPSELSAELTEALTRLGGGAVAVRSSASSEDTVGASGAGQHDSFLGVDGPAAVAARLSATWASLWSERSVAYRSGSAVAPEMAVIVQRQVDADVAGVLFTDTSGTQIEASWGLGESVVSGLVTPDAFAVSADGVLDRRTGDKRTRIDRARHGTVTTEVAPELRERLCLNDQQILRLARLGHEVAAHLGAPQDIEFALEHNHLWLLQSRPITAPLPHPTRSTAQLPQPARTDPPPHLTRTATDLLPPSPHTSAEPGRTATTPLPQPDHTAAASPPPARPVTDQPPHSANTAAATPPPARTSTEAGRTAATPLPQSDHLTQPLHTPTDHPTQPVHAPTDHLARAVRAPSDHLAQAGRGASAPESGSLAGTAQFGGTGGSPGLVSGPARLVYGPEDFGRVQAGDILVCRFTDPAWTPLFGVVGGVITETGGRLSHAAIVAREHRIPAVLGVPSAMTTLSDGQPVAVNGTTGTIHT